MAPKTKKADLEQGSERKDVPHWHALEKEDVMGVLGLSKTVRSTGLTSQEAKARLDQYGPNKLSAKEKKSLLMRIWCLVNNVLVGILVFIAIVSTVKGILAKNTQERITNFLEVGLICMVIM